MKAHDQGGVVGNLGLVIEALVLDMVERGRPVGASVPGRPGGSGGGMLDDWSGQLTCGTNSSSQSSSTDMVVGAMVMTCSGLGPKT